MSDEKPGVVVQRRLVPFPNSISAEAQDALRRLVGEDGVPYNAAYAMPPLEDRDAWIALKVAADARYAASMGNFAGTLRAEVETIQLDQAIVHIAQTAAPVVSGCAYIDLHGGALIFGGGEACRVGARMHADQHGVHCYGVDYRTPPEHPFPAALDDCLAAYRYVLDRHDAGKVVIGGRSAGGNLALAMLLRGREEGLPMPAGLVLLSPEVDLTESGDSFQTNQLLDVMLPRPLMTNNLLYAAGADLAHPYLSPLFGDLRGFPATFIQTGTRDLFLSNAVRLHRLLRRLQVPTELHVFEAMPHGGFMGGTPEDRELAEETSRFVRECWRSGEGDGA